MGKTLKLQWSNAMEKDIKKAKREQDALVRANLASESIGHLQNKRTGKRGR